MLSLARPSTKHLYTSFSRCFAEFVPHRGRSGSRPSSYSSVAVFDQKNEATNHKRRITVREDHGLYAFFRRKEEEDLLGDARYEVFETPDKAQVPTGRAWMASELRLKSFKDLHTLWYVVLRERNLLATQKEETRRMGVTNAAYQVSTDKVYQCRKTMARIKAVLNERRLAYNGAVKILEKQQDEIETRKVLEHQTNQFKQERAYSLRRAAYQKAKRASTSMKKPISGDIDAMVERSGDLAPEPSEVRG